jgi:hypothetical protein
LPFRKIRRASDEGTCRQGRLVIDDRGLAGRGRAKPHENQKDCQQVFHSFTDSTLLSIIAPVSRSIATWTQKRRSPSTANCDKFEALGGIPSGLGNDIDHQVPRPRLAGVGKGADGRFPEALENIVSTRKGGVGVLVVVNGEPR